MRNANDEKSFYPSIPIDSIDGPSQTPSAPPPPGYQMPMQPRPMMQQPQTTIIHRNSVVTAPRFGPYPVPYTCPNCNASITTEVESTPGSLAYILSGVLCLLGAWCCCCFVPCCVKRCKDIEHRCPNCHHKLGLFKRL